MPQTNPAATPYNTQTPALPELWTKAEAASFMRRTPSGLDKLRARDPNFPKAWRDGDNRRSRIYFVRSEIEAYLSARLEAREVA